MNIDIKQAEEMADSGKHNLEEIVQKTGINRKALTKHGINKERIKEARVAVIRRYKAIGLTGRIIAAKIGLEPKALYNIIAEMEITKGSERLDVVSKRVLGKRELEEGRGVTKQQSYFTEELAGKYDLWEFSKDIKKMGKYLITTEKGLFGSAILNIPYRDYQPAKRLHLIGRSLYEWKEDPKSKEWVAFSNYVEIISPDKPLMDVERHDISTLNLTVGYPDNIKDVRLTEDDACIISLDTAKRFKFIYNIPDSFVMDNKPAPEFNVEMGSRVMPVTGKDYIDDSSIPKATGTFIVKKIREVKIDNDPDSVGVYDVEGYITGEREAQIGDKLTGLTGLKTVIGEVREGLKSDIVIHSKEVWGAKASSKRGGLVKELKEHGKIMVGLRKDTLPEYQASYTGGMRVSKTVYPVMKLYAEGTLRSIIENNSRFDEVLKLLHLKYDKAKGRFMLLPEDEIDTEDIQWERYPHVLYEGEVTKHEEGDIYPVYKETVTRYFKATEINQMKVYDTWERAGKKEREWMKEEAYETVEHKEGIYKVAWDYCYNPSFFAPYFIDTRGVLRHVQLFLRGEEGNNGKTWEDIEDSDNISYPWSSKPQQTGRQKAEGVFTYSAVKDVILDQLFCPIRDGYFMVIVPQVDLKPNVVELNLSESPDFGKDYKGKKYGLIIREPVVSKQGIVCVEVQDNRKIPKGVMRVSPVIVRAMHGDFDGDRLSILPYYAKGLLPTAEEMKEDPVEVVAFDVDKIKPIKRSEDDLISEAIRFQNDFYKDQTQVGRYGGIKNKAVMSNDSEKVQKEVLKLAEKLEMLLADMPETTEKKEEKRKELKEAEAALKDFIDEDIPINSDIKRLKELRDVQLWLDHRKPVISHYEGYEQVDMVYKDIPKAKHERLLWFKPLKYLEILFLEGGNER